MCYDVLNYYREEKYDCPVCLGRQVVPNTRWLDFFAAHPEFAHTMCEYFGVDDWIDLPQFNYACPECFQDTPRVPPDEIDIPF